MGIVALLFLGLGTTLLLIALAVLIGGVVFGYGRRNWED